MDPKALRNALLRLSPDSAQVLRGPFYRCEFDKQILDLASGRETLAIFMQSLSHAPMEGAIESNWLRSRIRCSHCFQSNE